jgi:exodeoxyribonuclease VII small subunit
MPKTAKSAGAKSVSLDDLPFEQALEKLEAIVEAMEGDELPLESMLSRYEEGVRLVKACQSKLAAAEVRIRRLEQNTAGELKLEPLDLSERDVEEQEDESLS